MADVEVVGGLQDLESDFSSMMTDTRKDLADCDIGEVQFYLDSLFDVDEFRKYQNIDEVLRKLRRDHIDTFNIRYLERLISRFHQSDAIIKTIEKYEEKKEEFLRATAVKEFQQAVVSRAETLTPRRMANTRGVRYTTYNERCGKACQKSIQRSSQRLGQDKCHTRVHCYHLVHYRGSLWRTSEIGTRQLTCIAVLREEGVEEVSIVGEKRVTLSTRDGHDVSIQAIVIIMMTSSVVCVYLQVNISEITGNYTNMSL